MCRVTQIVNQPFPSKVHELTERVNRNNRELRVISDAGHFTQYKDVGVSGWFSSGFTLKCPKTKISPRRHGDTERNRATRCFSAPLAVRRGRPFCSYDFASLRPWRLRGGKARGVLLFVPGDKAEQVAVGYYKEFPNL